MEMRKSKAPLVIFLLLTVMFIILNMLDGAPLWDSMIRYGGWANTLPHSILTLGTGPYQAGLRWGNIPWNIGSAFPGIVFAVFPLLAIVFSGKGKRVAAIILSVIHLNLALFFTLSVIGLWWPLAVCWLAYAVTGLLLLLHAAGAIKSRKGLAVLFFVLCGVSVLAYVGFSCFQLSLRGVGSFVGLRGLQQSFLRSPWQSYAVFMYRFGGFFYPLSRAVLYGAFGAGMLCGSRRDPARKVV